MATKIYTGRIYSLKNIWRIHWQSHNSIPAYRKDDGTYKKGTMTRDEIGDNVLILDERAKRVQIMTKRGKPIWLSKYYLHTEIREKVEGNIVGEVSKLRTDIMDLALKVEDKEISNKLQSFGARMAAIQNYVDAEY